MDVEGGQITVTNDYHSHLPSLAGVYPITGYADYYLRDGLDGRTVIFDDIATDPRTMTVYEARFLPIHVRARIRPYRSCATASGSPTSGSAITNPTAGRQPKSSSSKSRRSACGR